MARLIPSTSFRDYTRSSWESKYREVVRERCFEVRRLILLRANNFMRKIRNRKINGNSVLLKSGSIKEVHEVSCVSCFSWIKRHSYVKYLTSMMIHATDEQEYIYLIWNFISFSKKFLIKVYKLSFVWELSFTAGNFFREKENLAI